MRKKFKITISLKERIAWSFAILVLLFVFNGIVTISTLDTNRKLSKHISAVIEPSLQCIGDFDDMLVNSKMYTTNWVFLRSNVVDKAALRKLHDSDYPALKQKLHLLEAKWDNKQLSDSLNNVFTRFEELLVIEKKLMRSLSKFENYDDLVVKFSAEATVEDELIPRTAALSEALNKIVSFEERLRDNQNNALEQSSVKLRILISILAITITGAGFILSIYLCKSIIHPINKIRLIINDLGKGVTKKVNHTVSNHEIGEMVRAVNSLSDKLKVTATFATEIGNRNFNTFFEPLGPDDTLGLALVAMRDNIKASDAKLNEAQHIAQIGSWERDLKTNKITLSDEMFNIFEIDRETFDFTFPGIMEYIHPDDKEYAMSVSNKNLYMDPVPYECRIVTAKGEVKNIFVDTKVVLGDFEEVERTFGIAQDITRRKRDELMIQSSEASLEIKNKELLQKNKELEQFAYVASHDLQEPLRTTASFVSLFQRQYRGRLDENADKYLAYIGKASDRMQALIKDLLDYSLIGAKKEAQEINCNLVLQEVLDDLERIIKETNACIHIGDLPTVKGSGTEIKQLFQNLLINAIKFRKQDTIPQIQVFAEQKDSCWQFGIKDNGIGIDEQYKERIFVIFQRLHTRSEYEGSGIGLSHCRKIVEMHGGKIWIESQLGVGTTFYFTIEKVLCNKKKKER